MRILVLALLACLLLAPAGFGADIAYLSSYNNASVFGDAGHNVTQLSLLSIEVGALALYDVLVIGHLTDDDWSSQACERVQTFLQSGGGLVAEWNSSMVVFDSVAGSALLALHPTCSFFSGHISGGGLVETNTPLYHTTAADDLTAGLPNPIALGIGSEFFYRITGITAPWTVEARYQSTDNNWYPALLKAPYGNGCIVAATFDLFDVLPASGQGSSLFENMIATSLDCQVDSPALFTDGFETGTATQWETVE